MPVTLISSKKQLKELKNTDIWPCLYNSFTYWF